TPDGTRPAPWLVPAVRPVGAGGTMRTVSVRPATDPWALRLRGAFTGSGRLYVLVPLPPSRCTQRRRRTAAVRAALGRHRRGRRRSGHRPRSTAGRAY